MKRAFSAVTHCTSHDEPPGDCLLPADECDSKSAQDAETELVVQSVSDCEFRYLDVFAGSSAFTEKARDHHGVAIGFVE